MDDSAEPPRFRVMRQDDNGGEFEVQRFATRPQAEAVAAEFTARGHKQLYWVERVVRSAEPLSRR